MSELCNIQIFPFDYKRFLGFAYNLHKDAVQYKHHGTEVIEGMTTAKFMNREVIDLVCEIGIKADPIIPNACSIPCICKTFTKASSVVIFVINRAFLNPVSYTHLTLPTKA